MDISSKEEVLQNKLTFVKEELKTRSKELEESTIAVHELKYNLNSVESERDTLQTDLKHSKNCLTRIRNELEETNSSKDFIKEEFGNFKTASERQKMKLELELGSYRNELEGTHDQIVNLNLLVQSIKLEQEEDREEANGTIDGLSTLIAELKGTLSNLHQTSKQQEEAMTRKELALKESRAREEALRQELAREKQVSSTRSKEIEEANKSVGTIAVLAEDLKGKKLSLERSLARQDQNLDRVSKELDQSRAQVASFRTKLAYVKDVSELRTKELESSVVQKQQDVQAACAVIANLEASITNFKRETVHLKNVQDDLEDSLEEKEKDLGEACEHIGNLKTSLEELFNETKTMQKERDEKCVREEALRKELVEQKIAHEQRLEDIKEILGFKKVTTGLYEANKTISFRVPLLSNLKFA
jgi:chromosome segregation ATPase